MNFGVIDAKNSSIICAVKAALSDLYIPAVSHSSNWGDLSGKESQPSRAKFLGSLETFVEVLGGAQDSLEEAITLEECTSIDLSKFFSPSTYSIATNSTEMLEAIEAQALVWVKQIEQVYTFFSFLLMFFLIILMITLITKTVRKLHMESD